MNPSPRTGKAVGIDVNKAFPNGSDGRQIENPRFRENSASKPVEEAKVRRIWRKRSAARPSMVVVGNI